MADQAQGYVNEAVLHIPKDRLIVGETSIRVNLVDNIDIVGGHEVSLKKDRRLTDIAQSMAVLNGNS